jgi:hypothetical protein
MAESIDSLILDLLEWVAREERTYAQTMDAWRTSCPRLPVWEEANTRGLVTTSTDKGRSLIRITSAGIELLRQQRSNRGGGTVSESL